MSIHLQTELAADSYYHALWCYFLVFSFSTDQKGSSSAGDALMVVTADSRVGGCRLESSEELSYKQ